MDFSFNRNRVDISAQGQLQLSTARVVLVQAFTCKNILVNKYQ